MRAGFEFVENDYELRNFSENTELTEFAQHPHF